MSEEAQGLAADQHVETSATPQGTQAGEDSSPNARQGFLFGTLALLLAGAGLRAWSVATLASNLRIQDPILDSRHYFTLALRVAAGEGWPAEPFFFGPLYPAFLAALFRIAPPTPLSAQIAQSLLGLLALLCLILAVRRWFGEEVALVAGLLFILWGPILAIESQILMAPLLLTASCLLLWLWPARDSSPWRYLLFGILGGILAVGRAGFLLIPLLALLLILFGKPAGPGGRPSRSRPVPSSGRARPPHPRLIPALLLIAGLLLPLIPQAIHQTRAVGHLQILTLNGGMNLFVGNNPAARGIFSQPPALDLDEDVTGTRSAARLAGRPLTIEEGSRFWMHRALTFMREQPGRLLALWGRKALLFLSPDEIPQINDFQILAEQALPLRVAFLRFGMILPFVLLGVWRGWRQHRNLAPWLTLIASGWIVTILFFAAARYRIPLMPAFIALAAYGLVQSIRAVRGGHLLPLIGALSTAIVLQLLPASYSTAEARAFDAFQLGLRYTRAGRIPAALQAYEQAVAAAPESGEAWHGRGTALYRLGRHAEAVAAYRKALRCMPHSAVTCYALGLAYLQMGEPGEAARAFEFAVQLNANKPSYRLALGDALALAGRREEAVAAWQEVLELDADNPEARVRLQEAGVNP
ncbi:MAG: tetratricopeptide repeat protein [Candidatus Eisenbacteria sp.]|nr:tetratricopeptide repeat protein [Candidatus Eisenbacteria bacterium]